MAEPAASGNKLGNPRPCPWLLPLKEAISVHCSALGSQALQSPHPSRQRDEQSPDYTRPSAVWPQSSLVRDP